MDSKCLNTCILLERLRQPQQQRHLHPVQIEVYTLLSLHDCRCVQVYYIPQTSTATLSTFIPTLQAWNLLILYYVFT